MRITLPDDTVIEFPPEVLALSRQPGIRRGVQAVVEPLGREGIAQVELRQSPNEPPTVTITSDDLSAITDATADEHQGPLITDQRYQQFLTVTWPNFQPGNKWRLNDGQATFWVAMEDPAFLAQIDRGEVAFRKNDRLRAEVWLRQWQSASGELHTERAVTRVIQHVPSAPGVQGDLFGT